MTVTLYSKPACAQCNATKRAFNKQGIAYTEVDMSTDLEALEMVKSMGFAQAPVVMAGEDSWSGFRPDKIKGLVEVAAAAAV